MVLITFKYVHARPAKAMYGRSSSYSHVGRQYGPRQAKKRPTQHPENLQSHRPIFHHRDIHNGPPNKKVRSGDNPHAPFDGLPHTFMHLEEFCSLLFPLKTSIPKHENRDPNVEFKAEQGPGSFVIPYRRKPPENQLRNAFKREEEERKRKREQKDQERKRSKHRTNESESKSLSTSNKQKAQKAKRRGKEERPIKPPTMLNQLYPCASNPTPFTHPPPPPPRPPTNRHHAPHPQPRSCVDVYGLLRRYLRLCAV